MISVPEHISRRFVYVDCGARGEAHHPFLSAYPQAQYIGFEADAEESARLQENFKHGRKIFPVGVGRKKQVLPFYITRNPACSSFIEPDHSFFGQFLDTNLDTEVQSVVDLPVVAMDEYLPKMGIFSVDFIELDTQGSELDILKGAEKLLNESVVGVMVEVEFSPIYKNQPLFADIDSFLRSHGFTLFDVSRHRYRRKAALRELPTRGHIVHGHSLYMRDFRLLSGSDCWEKSLKLAMVADFFGYWDYAYEIIQFLISLPECQAVETLVSILNKYEEVAAKKTKMYPVIQFANRLRLQKLLETIVRLSAKFVSAYQIETGASRKSWSD